MFEYLNSRVYISGLQLCKRIATSAMAFTRPWNSGIPSNVE